MVIWIVGILTLVLAAGLLTAVFIGQAGGQRVYKVEPWTHRALMFDMPVDQRAVRVTADALFPFSVLVTTPAQLETWRSGGGMDGYMSENGVTRFRREFVPQRNSRWVLALINNGPTTVYAAVDVRY